MLHKVIRGMTKHAEPATARKDADVVAAFLDPVLSCLTPAVAEQCKDLLGQAHLGIRRDTGRIGILFGAVIAGTAIMGK